MNGLYLDWVVSILNLYSYYLIGNHKKIGFILGFIGCIAGIILFAFKVFSLPLFIMYICFSILNLLNYYKWSK